MVTALHRWGVVVTGGGRVIAGGGCITQVGWSSLVVAKLHRWGVAITGGGGGGLSKGSGGGQQWWKMETSEDEGLGEIFAVCVCICIHIELPIFPNSISIY